MHTTWKTLLIRNWLWLGLTGFLTPQYVYWHKHAIFQHVCTFVDFMPASTLQYNKKEKKPLCWCQIKFWVLKYWILLYLSAHHSHEDRQPWSVKMRHLSLFPVCNISFTLLKDYSQHYLDWTPFYYSGCNFKKWQRQMINTEFTVYYQDLENLQTSSQLQVFRHEPV